MKTVKQILFLISLIVIIPLYLTIFFFVICLTYIQFVINDLCNKQPLTEEQSIGYAYVKCCDELYMKYRDIMEANVQ